MAQVSFSRPSTRNRFLENYTGFSQNYSSASYSFCNVLKLSVLTSEPAGPSLLTDLLSAVRPNPRIKVFPYINFTLVHKLLTGG